MEIRLLGPVGIWHGSASQEGAPLTAAAVRGAPSWDHGGAELPITRAQQRCVLAVLAINPGQAVPSRTLVDCVWGERPPDSAAHSLHAHVSRLRRTLAAAGGGALIRRLGDGYRLEIDRDRIDLHQVRRLAAEARTLRSTGNGSAERVGELLREACVRWRGVPLSGLGGDWAARVRVGLNQERLALFIDRYRVELQLGADAAVIGPLSELLAEYPLAEPLAGLQMLALYRCGRQAEALDVYARIRRALVEEIGDEPGADLRTLHEQVLRRDPRLDRPARAGPALDRPAAQLPADVPAFTGRQVYLEQLDGLLAEPGDASSVVISAVDGMAGVGKTALAVHWAHRVADRFPDGQLFIDLRGFTTALSPVEPGDALDRMLRALGVPGERIPVELDDRAALWRSVLAGRRMLIVLDNAATEAQVAPLLPGAPGCLVLVTSRRRLVGLEATHTVSLDMLPLPDALTLFARAVGPARLANQPREPVVETVELCGRLPLAIRIVAARLRSHPIWSVADLVERLRDEDQRLAELADGPRGVATALDLSYQQLAPDQQRMYQLLSLHPGPDIEPYAAAALADTSVVRARRCLDRLLEAHLLQEPAAGRYVFHDLVRAHAAGLAAERQAEAERRAVLARLLDHYRHAASVARDAAYPYEQTRRPQVPPATATIPDLSDRIRATGWLDTELPNLLAAAAHAAAHGWPTHTWHLSATLHRHLSLRGRYRDAETLHRQALRTARTAGEAAGELDALTSLGNIHRLQGRHELAFDYFGQALARARATGFHTGELNALTSLGSIRWLQGRPELARGYFEEALEIARANGNRSGELSALLGLANVQRRQGEYEPATRNYQHVLTRAREAGSRNGQFEALQGLGRLHLAAGRPAVALAHHQQALELATDLRQPSDQARAHDGLAHVHQASHRPERARQHWQTALEIITSLGIDHTEDQEASAGAIRAHLARLLDLSTSRT